MTILRITAWLSAAFICLIAAAHAEDGITHLTLTDNELNIVSAALGKQPAEQVFQTLLKIQNQYQAQHQPPLPAKTDPPKDEPKQ